MRPIAAFVAAAIAAGCGPDAVEPEPRAPAPRTELDISVRSRPGQQPHEYRLTCGPARGTVPDPAGACRDLARLGAKAFLPTPAAAVCTQIYGGPQVATVEGVVAGDPVRATLTRHNGCEIDRWERLRKVVPVPPGQQS